MEIPSNLKSLYKHWEYHINPIPPKPKVELKPDILSDIFEFATERQLIWERKFLIKNPLTDDPILKVYRFCNIYRELDRQTIEIHTLLHKFINDFDHWFLNVMFTRFICNVKTVQEIGLLSFSSINNNRVYENLMNLPSPKYGSAYIFPISIIMKSRWSTRELFLTKYLPLKITSLAQEIKRFNKVSVSEALSILLPVLGFNFKFHLTECLIDLAYQFPQYIDLSKEFPIGPGSLPTMRSLNSNAKPELVCQSLSVLDIPNFPYLEISGEVVNLSCENWEGIGCEYRKYVNIKRSLGKRRKYLPS